MSFDAQAPLYLCGLFLAYHVFLAYLTSSKPLATQQGRSNHMRYDWVQGVMANHNDILAIQTLRNWTMAATFLASTAILIAFGTLNLVITTETAPVHMHLFPSANQFWVLKLFILSGNFILAFFHFALAIRYYNHAGFLINVPGTEVLPRSIDRSACTVNKGARHYTYGMRHYYLSVPIVCWLFGTEFLLVSGVILLLMLIIMDYRH